MIEIFLVAFVSASSPLPPPPAKEVVIERLVGLPAKREEYEIVLPKQKIKRKGYDESSDVNSKGFGSQPNFNRRGFRKTAGSKEN